MLGDNRVLSLLVLFLNTFMDAYKAFITLVFISEGIISTINFTDFLHHSVHILNGFLGLLSTLGREPMLSEILAEFLSKKNEAILFMVKIGLKFTLYFLGSLAQVIHYDAQFLRHTLFELKLQCIESYIDNARYIGSMVSIVEKVNALNTPRHLVHESWNRTRSEFFNLLL